MDLVNPAAEGELHITGAIVGGKKMLAKPRNREVTPPPRRANPKTANPAIGGTTRSQAASTANAATETAANPMGRALAITR